MQRGPWLKRLMLAFRRLSIVDCYHLEVGRTGNHQALCFFWKVNGSETQPWVRLDRNGGSPCLRPLRSLSMMVGVGEFRRLAGNVLMVPIQLVVERFVADAGMARRDHEREDSPHVCG
ncbi:MAG: hypothetical protein M2R45_00249 [Verrucomicrobia subdivision 3 bacterium]|nr:hypothetical protein [Limisphaerales bacterium]MCS1412992.1 hypothetical protein [Limisphaerales bacterium]